MRISMKKNSKLILVVEDDETYLSFWRRFLSVLGYEMIYAKSCEEAIPKIKKSNIQLCIFDIILPGENGYQLLNEVLKINPDMPALLTTAYGSNFRRFKALPNKFHLLHKPFSDLNKLQKLIRHLVDKDNVFNDADEDSFSDSTDYPEITEWSF